MESSLSVSRSRKRLPKLAVPMRQSEAGYAAELTGWQTLVHIVAPQAGRISLPMMGTTFIYAFQATALAYMVGVINARSHRRIRLREILLFMPQFKKYEDMIGAENMPTKDEMICRAEERATEILNRHEIGCFAAQAVNMVRETLCAAFS